MISVYPRAECNPRWITLHAHQQICSYIFLSLLFKQIVQFQKLSIAFSRMSLRKVKIAYVINFFHRYFLPFFRFLARVFFFFCAYELFIRSYIKIGLHPFNLQFCIIWEFSGHFWIPNTIHTYIHLSRFFKRLSLTSLVRTLPTLLTACNYIYFFWFVCFHLKSGAKIICVYVCTGHMV